MAKSTGKPDSRDAAALKEWRKALPGVPDDQIVIPRYHAKSFVFPPPNDTGEERESPAPRLIGQTIDIAVPPAERAKFVPGVKRTTSRTWRQAARWWDSLGTITPLKLNQSVFTRRDKWKEVMHHAELMFCLALCYTWLNLPKRSRTAAAAKKIVADLYRQKLRCWERGEIEPGVQDTRWGNQAVHSPAKPNFDQEAFRRDFSRVVEAAAAKLPEDRRDAYYRKISEGLNRASARRSGF